MNTRLFLPGFAATLLCLPGVVRGDDAAVALFGHIDLGLAWLSEDQPHLGRYSGLDDSGLTPLLETSLAGTRDGFYWRVDGRRTGLDSRRVDLALGQRGQRRLTLSGREMPGWTLSGGRTPFIVDSGGRFELPGDWQGGDSTAQMPALADSLAAVSIGSDRRRLALGYWQRLSDRIEVDFDVREQRREGNRLVGAMFGFTGGNPRGMLLPAQVDDRTRIIDAGLTYSSPAGHQLGLAWHGSFYRNGRDAIEFRNPFSRHPQWAAGTGFPDGFGRIADHPDNSAQQLRGFGAWKLGQSTRLTADLAAGRMRQNDVLLPYTVNPQLDVDTPLPVQRLDAEIHTTLANLRLVTRPVDRLDLKFNYRHDDRDNRTPSLAWRVVGADSENQRDASATRINLPYSLRRQKFDIDARWRLSGRNRLSAGVHLLREDRDDFAEVERFDEWRGSVGWRGRVKRDFGLRLDLEHARRRFDEYEGRAPFRAGRLPGSFDDDDFENHPLLRKYNVADRDRNRLNARLDWQAGQRLSLGLGGHYSRDRYADGRFGLEESEVSAFNADAGYQVNRYLSLTGFVSRERYRADQSGRDWPGFAPDLAFDPDRDWWARHDDRVDTASLGIEWRDLGAQFDAIAALTGGGRLDLGADWLYARTRGLIDVSVAEGLSAEPLPETGTRRNASALWLGYRFVSRWRLRLRVEHERFRQRDFAHEQVEADTVANLLLLGRNLPDYDATAVLLSVGYGF